jgi:hypothetical protein
LSHFANKAVAELAAGLVLDAARVITQSQTFADYDKLTAIPTCCEVECGVVVRWLDGHAEEAVSSLPCRIQGWKRAIADAAGSGREGRILYN